MTEITCKRCQKTAKVKEYTEYCITCRATIYTENIRNKDRLNKYPKFMEKLTDADNAAAKADFKKGKTVAWVVKDICDSYKGIEKYELTPIREQLKNMERGVQIECSSII